MPRITGDTEFIAHIGWPTHSFKAPMIYNPWFAHAGIDCVVVPMGCEAADYPSVLRTVFLLRNIRGALVTMPHKVSTVDLLDEASPTVRVAGACNAVRRGPDGRLQGDLFDGEGFVRGIRGKGFVTQGARALVVGCGGVGSAIAASLAAAGVAELRLHDLQPEAAEGLARRLQAEYPTLRTHCGSNDPAGCDLVVNGTPMGMEPGDPLPVDVDRIERSAFVGEVVMREKMTAFLRAAEARGCRYQVGADMLYEQIPAYLEFFGLPVASAERLRSLSRV